LAAAGDDAWQQQQQQQQHEEAAVEGYCMPSHAHSSLLTTQLQLAYLASSCNVLQHALLLRHHAMPDCHGGVCLLRLFNVMALECSDVAACCGKCLHCIEASTASAAHRLGGCVMSRMLLCSGHAGEHCPEHRVLCDRCRSSAKVR
jgi:hypothetical protein